MRTCSTKTLRPLSGTVSHHTSPTPGSWLRINANECISIQSPIPHGHRKSPPASRASEAVLDLEPALNEYADCNQLHAGMLNLITMARTANMVAATYKLAGVLCLKRCLPVLDVIGRATGVKKPTNVEPSWAGAYEAGEESLEGRGAAAARAGAALLAHISRAVTGGRGSVA